MFVEELNVPWYVAYPRLTVTAGVDMAWITGSKPKTRIAKIETPGSKRACMLERRVGTLNVGSACFIGD